MNSKMFLIIGGLILVASLFGFTMTSSPVEPKTIDEYIDECIQTQIKLHGTPTPTPVGTTITPAMKRLRATGRTISMYEFQCEADAPDKLRNRQKLYNGISMGGAGLGSLMFIYGLSLQRKEQG